MKAIILAAGIGNRIRDYTDKPKCLIETRNKTLIERYLEHFEELGIEDVVVVTGYRKDLVEQKIQTIPFKGSIRVIANSDYSRGSILSLWTAREELDDTILLMDGDVFFEKEILRRLMEAKGVNSIVIDTVSPNAGEECIAGIKKGRVCTIERGLKGDFDLMGEWVGFLKMEKTTTNILRRIVENNIEKGNLDIGYEDILPDLFKKVDFSFEDINGLKWVEIDFIGDVERVRKYDQ